MQIKDFMAHANAASSKLLVGSAAALLGLLGLSGALAEWPNALLPLSYPVAWFFFAVCISSIAVLISTLFGFFPNPIARWEWPWRWSISFALGMAALCFVVALWYSPGAFSDMTGRLPYIETPVR